MGRKPVIIPLNPSPMLYQKAEKRFFYTVGTSVTTWAFVDRQLFRIFRWLLKTDQKRCALLYYKDNAIGSRLKAVDEMFKSLVSNEEYLKEWKLIRLRIASLLPVRNIIAHHPVKRTGMSDGRKPVYIYSIHIEPYEAILAKEHQALKGKKEIDIDDLEEHSKSVEQVYLELRNFVQKLILEPS